MILLFINGYIDRKEYIKMHTIMVKDNNDVVAFGYNKYGQLGLGHNNDQNWPALIMLKIPILQIAHGFNHTRYTYRRS